MLKIMIALSAVLLTSCISTEQLVKFEADAKKVHEATGKLEKKIESYKESADRLQGELDRISEDLNAAEDRVNTRVTGLINGARKSVREERDALLGDLVPKENFRVALEGFDGYIKRMDEQAKKINDKLDADRENDNRIADFLGGVVEGFTKPVEDDMSGFKAEQTAKWTAAIKRVSALEQKTIEADAKATMAQNRIQNADKAGGVITGDDLKQTQKDLADSLDKKAKEFVSSSSVERIILYVILVVVILLIVIAVMTWMGYKVPFLHRLKGKNGSH